MKAANGIRFGMFAVSHILWSLICSPFILRFLGGGLAEAVAATVVMMAGYLPWGWLCAHFGDWLRPDRKQSLWAVFLPAGIAWVWAGTTAFCLYGDIAIAAILGLPAFLLAAPSLLFVMSFMGAAGTFYYSMGFYDETPIMGIAIFFAGLLPPLLFYLGSLLGSKRTQKNEKPETA